MRLDQYIVKNHGFSRNKSQSIIHNGLVSVNGKIILKSAFEIT